MKNVAFEWQSSDFCSHVAIAGVRMNVFIFILFYFIFYSILFLFYNSMYQLSHSRLQGFLFSD